jgi:DNA-binding IscR family transcriptional regulator
VGECGKGVYDAEALTTRPLWEWLEERIAKWLSELSLEDLAKDRL